MVVLQDSGVVIDVSWSISVRVKLSMLKRVHGCHQMEPLRHGSMAAILVVRVAQERRYGRKGHRRGSVRSLGRGREFLVFAVVESLRWLESLLIARRIVDILVGLIDVLERHDQLIGRSETRVD